MRAGVPRALMLLCAATGLVGCGDTGMAPTPHGQVVPGSDRGPAPPFDGELLGGGPFESRSLSGQVVVLNFWGSWCGPCRREVPELQALSERADSAEVAVVGVNVRDQEQLAQAFVAEEGATYPSLFDPRGEVSTAFASYPITRTPATVLIDQEGRVAAVYIGAVRLDDISEAVTALVDEP